MPFLPHIRQHQDVKDNWTLLWQRSLWLMCAFSQISDWKYLKFGVWNLIGDSISVFTIVCISVTQAIILLFHLLCYGVCSALTLLDGQQGGHLVWKTSSKTLGMVANRSEWDVDRSTMLVQRVSACSVRMLRIKITGDWESQGNQVTQVYLENGC